MAPAADSRPSRIVRIGQIVPSSNTTMETEIPAMLRAREQHFAERFTFHSSRMRMKRVSAEELAAMNQEGLRCAAELADARVDVMSTACLVAIMAQGPGYHRQVEEDFKRVVAENGARSKVMTSAGALIHGLKKLGAKKISLLAPYIKPLTAKVVSYIEHEGIEVLDRISFEIPDNLEVGAARPDAPARRSEAPEDRQRRRGRALGLRPDAVAAGDPGRREDARPAGHLDLGLHGAQHARPARARAAHSELRSFA